MKETKAPTVLFLGAGASAPLGFPVTKQVMAEIGLEPANATKLEEVTEHTELLTKIYNQLAADKRDLEGILDFVRIANDELSSHHLDILRDKIQAQSTPDFKPTIGDIVTKHKEELKELEDNIKEHMFKLYVFQPEKHTDKVEKIYKPLIDALLLDPIFETDVEELPIFTTNYDLAIENLADRPFMRNFDLVDGFELVGRHPESVFSLSEYEKPREKTAIKLFKLHGGLNWLNRKRDNRIIAWSDIINPRGSPNYDATPWIIYPGGYGPYPRDEFHVLHEYLETYLTKAKRCIVIGYTFRDIGRASHIFDDVMRDLNKQLSVIISDMKPNIDQLKEVKNLFGRYEGRYEYYSGGIEALPQHLKGMVSAKKPAPKPDITSKEPI